MQDNNCFKKEHNKNLSAFRKKVTLPPQKQGNCLLKFHFIAPSTKKN